MLVTMISIMMMRKNNGRNTSNTGSGNGNDISTNNRSDRKSNMKMIIVIPGEPDCQ